MGLTNYGERKVFELLKGGGTYYIGLLTTAPTDSDSGVEVTGGAYARQAFPASDPTTDSNGETTVRIPPLSSSPRPRPTGARL